MTPSIQYLNRLNELLDSQKKLQQKKSVFGLLRFGSIAAIIAACYYLWSWGLIYVFPASAALLAIFIILIYKDLANRSALKHIGHLISITQHELKALEGEYFQFADGSQFLPKEHGYAVDLDIYGHASLYQFLNRTTSDMGAATLASWLSEPVPASLIMERQEAVKELKEKFHWRQDIRAIGIETNIRQTTFDKLKAWMHEPTVFLQFIHWKWLRVLLPVIIVVIVATAIVGFIPMKIMYAMLLLYAFIAYFVYKAVSPMHEKLSRIVDEMNTLSESIRLIEKETFIASLNIRLQQQFVKEQSAASVKIRRIKKILNRLDIRYNIMLSAPLNILFLWDLQQALDLEKWKKAHAADVENWFLTLGVFEALNSFATIHFNNPGWCFPALHNQYFYIDANELGHPLIPVIKRVNNQVQLDKSGTIMLVTGSNMAGKSTYLRSVGVNTVLAMAGAPVCAASFTVSPVQLISSMRISDNLEESTSTFYAELKKLKAIIDKVNAGEKVFILLDEILRGTNSFDRHTGSVALIKQLIQHKATAIIATHDLALAEIIKTFPDHIRNYHFDVQINNEELYFDYKLKSGVCTNLNASLLMKKIGIEL